MATASVYPQEIDGLFMNKHVELSTLLKSTNSIPSEPISHKPDTKYSISKMKTWDFVFAFCNQGADLRFSIDSKCERKKVVQLFINFLRYYKFLSIFAKSECDIVL